jgi:hypothetical protein
MNWLKRRRLIAHIRARLARKGLLDAAWETANNTSCPTCGLPWARWAAVMVGECSAGHTWLQSAFGREVWPL